MRDGTTGLLFRAGFSGIFSELYWRLPSEDDSYKKVIYKTYWKRKPSKTPESDAMYLPKEEEL